MPPRGFPHASVSPRAYTFLGISPKHKDKEERIKYLKGIYGEGS